jgi:putative hydrolase of the HAD superfamily
VLFDFYGVVNLGGEPNPEIIEFIETNNNKYLFGILSAAGIDIHAWLQERGIADFFAIVQTTQKLGISKYNPDFYKNALEALDLKAEECVFIDDNQYNTELAQDLGFKTVLYTPHKNFLDQVKAFL